MKANRDKPKMIARKGRIPEENEVNYRTRNSLIAVSKGPVNGLQMVVLSVCKAKAYDEKAVGVTWIRGKSRFNIAMQQIPLSENMADLLFRMLGVYYEAFERPMVQEVQRPKIIMP